MIAWIEFAAAVPELAAKGQRLLQRTEIGEALLASWPPVYTSWRAAP
jgi:hypothetical protein